LDPLRNELARVRVLLEVSTRGAFLHRSQTAHSPDRLEPAALEQERLARALVGPREHRSHHDSVRAGREGLHYVSGVLDTAVGDHRDAALNPLDGFEYRGELGHTHSRNDARRADRSRAYP